MEVEPDSMPSGNQWPFMYQGTNWNPNAPSFMQGQTMHNIRTPQQMQQLQMHQQQMQLQMQQMQNNQGWFGGTQPIKGGKGKGKIK